MPTSWRRSRKSHGGGVMDEESWMRSHGRGIIEDSWKRNHGGGIMEKESWKRNHGGEIHENEAWQKEPWRDRLEGVIEEESLRSTEGSLEGVMEEESVRTHHGGGLIETESRRSH